MAEASAFPSSAGSGMIGGVLITAAPFERFTLARPAGRRRNRRARGLFAGGTNLTRQQLEALRAMLEGLSVWLSTLEHDLGGMMVEAQSQRRSLHLLLPEDEVGDDG
jgi:hypothetical protein